MVTEGYPDVNQAVVGFRVVCVKIQPHTGYKVAFGSFWRIRMLPVFHSGAKTGMVGIRRFVSVWLASG